MRPGDSVSLFDIDGLPVRLILPEHEGRLVALPWLTNRILQRGRQGE